MPRKKQATPEQIAQEFKEGIEKFRDALRTPGARKAIEAHIDQLEDEIEICELLLDYISDGSDEGLRDLLPIDVSQLSQASQELSLRVEDLDQIKQLFDALTATFLGRPVEVENPSRLIDVLSRLSKPTSPKRFKPAFEQAFRQVKEAQKIGKSIPAKDLAQDLTPYEYKRNPESAIRSMQKGIARVEREHQSCVRQEIPSPFLSE